MNMHVHPAHVASLPVILREISGPHRSPEGMGVTHIPPGTLARPPRLGLWCAAVGRTAADVAALLFDQPMCQSLREVFEAEIRQAIAAEALSYPSVTDHERQHLEDVAWIAFDHRLERHECSTAGTGNG